HLALDDSSIVPIVDHVPPAGDTKAFETDESALTPRSPQIVIPLSQTRLRKARKTVRLEPPMSASIEACIARHAAALLPSLLVPTDIPEADMPPQKRACLTTPAPRFEVEESSTAGAARQPGPDLESDHRRYKVEQSELDDTVRQRTDEFKVRFKEAVYAREVWAGTEDRSAAIAAHVRTLEAQKMTPTRATPATTTTPTTTVTDAQLQALVDQGVAAALAERDADRSRNGDNRNDSGTDGRRQVPTQRECAYTDFLKCQPKNFKGTEGFVGLTQWIEKMESVFLISNCTIASQVKFASYTLEGSALT
nr:hypothetical protein [Tanacetum cinerariifolium]